MAHTGPYSVTYLCIKNRGFRLTCLKLVIPTALFAAIRDFHQWLAITAFDLPWLPGGSRPGDELPSTEALMQEALAKFQHSLRHRA